jgi:ankyrin repeat protein
VNNTFGEDRVTALMKFGHTSEHAQFLLSLRSDVNTKNIWGTPALVYVVSHKDVQPESVKILIDAGADVHVKSGSCGGFLNDKSVLMHMIISRHNKDIETSLAKILLAAGLDVNAVDVDNYSHLREVMLHYDINLDLVKILIDAGININCRKNSDKTTALMCALRKGYINQQLVKMLIQAKSDVNIKDKRGNSPIMYACQNEKINLDIVKILIEAGADVMAKNKKKETALTLAISSCRFIGNKTQILLIIDYLLQLPQLKQNVALMFNKKNHPQKVLLTTLCHTENITDVTRLEIFKLFMKSAFKDTTYLENIPTCSLNWLQDKYPLASVALLLNKPLQVEHSFALLSYVHVLLEAGFKMHQGISPLTIFIMNVSPNPMCNYPASIETPATLSGSIFIDFLIEHGSFVGQQKFPIFETKPRLCTIRKQLHLPDAIYFAIYLCEYNLGFNN